MLFNTLPFTLFLALTLLVYWLLKRDRLRQIFLLVASLFFYGFWDWRFVLLLLFDIACSYFCARAIHWEQERHRSGKIWLIVAFVTQIGLLSFFKYTNFLLDSVKTALSYFGADTSWTALHIILPVGISFFTFHGLSYVFDVYRKQFYAERSFVKIALYISFFPALVAGPIIYATDFLWQLTERRKFEHAFFLEGCRKFVMGFLLKAVFADNMATFVDPVFADLSKHDNLSIFAAALGFSCQIYFDFAGYSLMAIGTANLFGYWLPVNFNYPYRSVSPIEFWHRWHISLSTWLRNYLYIPLGGNRGSSLFQYRNLMITMLLGGLWHGASWNFILWGGIHGVALCTAHYFRKWSSQNSRYETWLQSSSLQRYLWVFLGWAITQCVVFFAWIPFRAATFSDALQTFLAVLGIRPDADLPSIGIPWLLLVLPILVDTFLLGSESLTQKWTIRKPTLVYLIIGIGFLIGLLFMYLGMKPFIYFQF